MDTIRLHKNRSLTVIICVLDVIIWIAVIAILFLGESPDDYLLSAFFGVFAIFLTAAICSIARWNLVFDGEGVTYTPMIGAAKRLAYREILRVTIGQGYIIYDSSGSKWAVFADDSTNAMNALNLMKAKGVKVDLF